MTSLAARLLAGRVLHMPSEVTHARRGAIARPAQPGRLAALVADGESFWRAAPGIGQRPAQRRAGLVAGVLARLLGRAGMRQVDGDGQHAGRAGQAVAREMAERGRGCCTFPFRGKAGMGVGSAGILPA